MDGQFGLFDFYIHPALFILAVDLVSTRLSSSISYIFGSYPLSLLSTFKWVWQVLPCKRCSKETRCLIRRAITTELFAGKTSPWLELIILFHWSSLFLPCCLFASTCGVGGRHRHLWKMKSSLYPGNCMACLTWERSQESKVLVPEEASTSSRFF